MIDISVVCPVLDVVVYPGVFMHLSVSSPCTLVHSSRGIIGGLRKVRSCAGGKTSDRTCVACEACNCSCLMANETPFCLFYTYVFGGLEELWIWQGPVALIGGACVPGL
jgi:hypothetical protein